jgi:hypothetical protein
MIILAPHVDDEVIGCYEFLNSNCITQVYYFFDLTSKRRREAYACGDHFGFAVNFVENYDTFADNFNYFIPPSSTIIVPNINDHHPQHKLLNKLAKIKHDGDIWYYSVDMNILCEPIHNPKKKHDTLNRLFPSQKKYFKTHEECYLFEKIVDNDFSCSYTFLTTLNEITAKTTICWLYGIKLDLLKKEIEDTIQDEMAKNINQSLQTMGRMLIKRLISYFNDNRRISVELTDSSKQFFTITYGV